MIKALKSMFEKQVGVERFDLIQTFHACKQEEDKLVAAYVLQMKKYVDQLERLGYVLPQDLIVGLILNGLTKDFARFVRNYNLHNMGKTIGELHAMFIEYEKEHPTKDDTCHRYKEVGHWKRKCLVYLVELLKKKKQVGSASSSGIFTIELFVFPNKSWVYDTGCGTHICITKHRFREARKLKQGALYLYVGNGVRAQVEAIRSYDLVLPNGLVIYLDNSHYAPSITRGVVLVHRLVENRFVQCVTDFEISISKNNVHYFNAIPTYFSIHTTTQWHNVVSERRNHTLLDMVRSMKNLTTLSLSFWDYALEYATHIFNVVPTKKVDKTPYELWIPKGNNELLFYFPHENKIVVVRYAEFFEKNLITPKVSGRAIDLEETQDEDTSHSEMTSKTPMEAEGFEPPQEKVIPNRRSERTHRTPNLLCLNVEVEEHSLGNLNEPTRYKAAMLDSKYNKWIDAMNAKIQSRIYNMVWVLVDIPPNCKIVVSKWIFKKKTDIDGIVHTYKARLVAKGYTLLYKVLLILVILEKYASFKDSFMVLSKHQEAGIKDLMTKSKGEVAFILGIKIYKDRSKRLIKLGQNAYLDKILKRYKMDNSKRGHIPMKEILNLNRTQEAKLRVSCYCDVGFETDRDDTKSQTRYVFILNGGAVDWKSSKQNTTAMSATEAEYIAASEAVWIRKFILGLGRVPTINEPIRMFCDNSSALYFANKPGVQRGTRHEISLCSREYCTGRNKVP
uniref:Retrovirus-related Pol polyprotein from transposon TNT 1-94-like beta-barrel domain-containing protein n=1 Tax=Tanacetum cinerariifolium TaxID=118510 RepID=A0A6L2MDZ9_TANCI|nr:hypothetical protein [Tanacetum cinerariifolium]